MQNKISHAMSMNEYEYQQGAGRSLTQIEMVSSPLGVLKAFAVQPALRVLLRFREQLCRVHRR